MLDASLKQPIAFWPSVTERRGAAEPAETAILAGKSVERRVECSPAAPSDVASLPRKPASMCKESLISIPRAPPSLTARCPLGVHMYMST